MGLYKVEDLGNFEVYEVWQSFMSMHKRNSEKTARDYAKRNREFFKMMLGKDIEHLSIDDIKSIKKKDVENNYISVLAERGNTDNTILTKLRSIRSFYNELLGNGYEVNPLVLKTNLKPKPKHHNSLTVDEYLNMLNFMKGEEDGVEKYLFSKLLYHVAYRKTATLTLTWDNFIQRRDAVTNEMVWLITAVDKGKEGEKPISDEFYQELKENLSEDGYIFKELSSSKGAYRRYERSMKKYGEQIGKNLSIHCMKATAITLGYAMTKDINLCKQLGGHSSIATTEIYIRDEESYMSQLSYQSSIEMNEDIIDEISHEELLEFIDGQQDIKAMIVARLNVKMGSVKNGK